jgi:hypothetical protein
VRLVDGMLSVEMEEGMLSMELARDADDCVWCSGRVDSMSEVGLGLFDRLVLEKVKDKMGNINCGEEAHCMV